MHTSGGGPALVTEEEAPTPAFLRLQGPTGTVYEGGLFKLAVDIPAR